MPTLVVPITFALACTGRLGHDVAPASYWLKHVRQLGVPSGEYVPGGATPQRPFNKKGKRVGNGKE